MLDALRANKMTTICGMYWILALGRRYFGLNIHHVL